MDNFHKCTNKCFYRTTSTFLKIKHVNLHFRSTRTVLFDCKSILLNYCKCENCDFKSNNKVTIQNHSKENCRQLKTIITSFNCQDCNFQTYSMIILLKHLVDSEHCNLEDWMECDHCAKWEHYLKTDLMKHIILKNTKWFKCNQCDYKAKQQYDLKRHISTRHVNDENIKWFCCDHCTFRSKYKSCLKSHKLRLHEKSDVVLFCRENNCSFEYRLRKQLKNHMLQKHTKSKDIKWFKCDQNLKSHNSKKHITLKNTNWFQCDYKEKKRCHLENNLVMKRTTNEIKWYKCEHCAHQTKYLSCFNRHTKTVHSSGENIEWFQCNHCLFKTKRNYNLKRHMLVHKKRDDVKWYKCQHCSYQAKRKQYLKYHISRKHKNQSESV